MQSFFQRSRVRTSFLRFAADNLLALALYIYSKMLNNPDFPATTPDMPTFLGAITNFQELLMAARSGDRTQIQLKNQAKAQLVSTLVALGDCVSFQSNGDPALIEGTGFPMYKQPEPRVLPKPTGVRITAGLNAGELLVKAITRARPQSFLVQYTGFPLGENSVWVSEPSTTKEYLLTGLTRGQSYWCRVGLVGGKKQVVFSDPVLSLLVQ